MYHHHGAGNRARSIPPYKCLPKIAAPSTCPYPHQSPVASPTSTEALEIRRVDVRESPSSPKDGGIPTTKPTTRTCSHPHLVVDFLTCNVGQPGNDWTTTRKKTHTSKHYPGIFSAANGFGFDDLACCLQKSHPFVSSHFHENNCSSFGFNFHQEAKQNNGG